MVPGKFKDEMKGRLIEEFVGLRAKMYSIKTSDGETKKTAKGILKVVTENVITHENYKECLLNRFQMRHDQTRIIQEKHQLFTATQNKISLSPFNDKKYIFKDLTTLSFGHYKIKEECAL